MIAVVTAAAARLGESAFGRWCGRFSAVVDCAIPLVLVVVVVSCLVSVVFRLVH